MATVTGLTAARMQEIIDATIVGAHITGDDLILELHDATEVNAGDVRGPTGPIGPAAEPGDVKTSIKTATHGNWLIFGATHVGAATTHPTLWALASLPASWKVGSDLVLPAMADTIVQGDGAGTAVGDITGANTKTLVAGNLPPHVHTAPVHNHSTPDHTHPMTHIHGMPHTHEHVHTHVDTIAAVTTVTTSIRNSSTAGATDSVMAASATGSSESQTNNPTATTSITGGVGAASDATTGGVSTPNTGGSSASVTGSDGGSVTGNNAAANTGNGPGTSTPVNVEQQALRLNYFIYGT